MVDPTRRQFLQGVTAMLAATKVQVAPPVLDVLVQTETPVPTKFPPTMLFAQLQDRDNNLRVINGRFPFAADEVNTLRAIDVIDNDYMDAQPAYYMGNGIERRALPEEITPENIAEAETPWHDYLSKKAGYMARTHAVFDALAVHPTELSKEALKGFFNGEGTGGDEHVDDYPHRFDGWPFEGGDDKRDELLETFQREREGFYAFADAKLSKSQAADVKGIYESAYQTWHDDLPKRADELTKHFRHRFIQAIRNGLARGFIDLSIEQQDGQMALNIRFNPMHPDEGTGYMIHETTPADKEKGKLRMRLSTYESINVSYEAMVKHHMVDPDRVQIDSVQNENETGWALKEVSYQSTDPALTEIMREIAHVEAKQSMMSQVTDMIHRMPYSARVEKGTASDEQQPDETVQYTVQFIPPPGADEVVRFQDDISQFGEQLELLDQVFVREEERDMADWNARTKTLSLNLPAGEFPKLEKAMEGQIEWHASQKGKS